jgi:hypothetical protein
LPRAFHLVFTSVATIGGEPPPTVSKISICPPSTVGSPAGRLKTAGVMGFATIFARMLGFTMAIFPGISSSAALADPAVAAATRHANPSALRTEMLRMSGSSPFVSWAGWTPAGEHRSGH